MTYHTEFYIKEKLQERETKKNENDAFERAKEASRKGVYSTHSITETHKPKEIKEKAQQGFVRVKSKGANDIRFITDDGSIINLPVVSATWNIEVGEIPTITVVLHAEVDLDGCIVKAIKGKKTVPIEEFINLKNRKEISHD